MNSLGVLLLPSFPAPLRPGQLHRNVTVKHKESGRRSSERGVVQPGISTSTYV